MISEKIYRPNAPLNQFVDLIWVGKASNLEIKSNHHAPLFTELIFNYGGGFQVIGQNIKNIVNKYDHQIISGLKTAPFQTKISGRYRSIGLILKPFCYGIIITQLNTYSLEVASEVLYESLFDREIPNFEKVESTLLKLFCIPQMDLDLIKFERYISKRNLSKGVMKDFNLSISISQKSFIEKFKKYYQLTPNDYFKLKKVNGALQLIQSNKTDKLTEIALESGFYDQSHFIRIFKKFCGYSPKKHLEFVIR